MTSDNRNRRVSPTALFAGVVVCLVGAVAACGGGTSSANDRQSAALESSRSAAAYESVFAAPTAPGSSVPPASTAPGSAPKIGGVAHSTGAPVAVTKPDGSAGEMTVTSITTTKTATSATGKAPANGYFVIASVTITVTSGHSFVVNPLEFYVRTPDGKHYDVNAGNGWAAVSSGTLDFQVVRAGESASGAIGFDASSPHGTLVLASSPSAAPLESWAF